MTVQLFRALPLMSLLLLGGCSGGDVAQKSAPPDWFTNPDQTYNGERYLLAPAEGPSTQTAQNRAFGNLARMFAADIQASQELFDKYREVKKEREIAGSRQKTVMITQSDVRSDQTLLNAQVLEQAKVGSKHYALVGMERRETLRIYTQRIEGNRKKISDYRTVAANAKHPVTRLTALKKALVLAKANERLQDQRAIIAGGGTSAASSPRPKLEKAVQEAQKSCPVVVRGDVPSSIRTQVKAILEARGLPTVKRPESAVLKARIRYEERATLPGRSDAHFLRWTLSIEVTDTVRSQTLETFTAERRAGAPSQTGARRRARNSARTTIEDDFSTFLEQTFLRIDQP